MKNFYDFSKSLFPVEFQNISMVCDRDRKLIFSRTEFIS